MPQEAPTPKIRPKGHARDETAKKCRSDDPCYEFSEVTTVANEPKPLTDSLTACIARIEAKRTGLPVEDHAKQVAAEVHAEVAPKGALPPGQGWMAFAPMPSDLCRVSPFFPMGKNEMAVRPFIRGLVITKCAWGEVTYTGPKLSTFEEDVLLAVLALLKTVEPSGEDKPVWNYTGPLRPILTAMGYTTTGKRNYERIKAALELLAVAGAKLQTKRGKWAMTTMLTWAGGDDKSRNISVTVNPYFAEAYAAGAVNLLDLAKRAELSRPVSKALHRFATSHRDDWRGHFLTLAAAINLDMDNPPKELRRQIKQAMAELRKIGVLSARSKFTADVVTLATSKPKTVGV